MDQDVISEELPARELRVGERLQAAREAAGFDIAQVAAQTRIPQRHLVSIEAGEFAKLPSRTYAVGFSRTYARMLGLDEREIIDQVRRELAMNNGSADTVAAKFEPGDPARVPGRGLAWFGLLAAVLFAGGIYSFYRSYFAPGLGPAPLTAPSAPTPAVAAARGAAPAQPAAAARGPVVFTATMDDTWVKFYDGSGERLFEALMARGDSFTVPADAQNPQVWTGRPYALDITVGGQPVPRLAEGDTIIKDVPVSAAALLARAQPPPSTAPAATATSGAAANQT